MPLSISSHAAILTPKSPTIEKEKVFQARNGGSAGVLPYFRDEKTNKTYFLFSRERGGPDKGTYADFGGGVDYDKKKHCYQSILDAAIRECYEESCKLYNFLGQSSQEFLKKNSHFYYNEHNLKGLLAFTPVTYKKSQQFLSQLKHLDKIKYDGHFREKNDFLWVEANSLMAQLNKSPKGHVTINVLQDNGKNISKSIQIRPYIANRLLKSQEILKGLANPLQKQLPGDPIKNPHQFKEVDSIGEVAANLKEDDKKRLLIVDLDETIMLAKHSLNSKIDKNYLKKKDFIPVEPNIDHIMANLRKKYKNMKVIAVTKRPYISNVASKQNAAEQLKKLKIPMSTKTYQNFNKKSLSSIHKGVMFDDSVLYTAGKNKGYYLDKFLEMTKKTFQPETVMMFDDKEDNLKDVSYFLKKRNLPFDGYLYRGAEKYQYKKL